MASSSSSSSSSATKFMLVEIGEHPHGETAPLDSLKPEDLKYKLLARAALSATNILASEQCRSILADFAAEFDNIVLHGKKYSGSKTRASSDVKIWIEKIRAEFPIVAINKNLRGNTILGFHEKFEWDGKSADWNPNKQWIMINSQRMDALLKAATAARTSKSPEANKKFLTHLFQLATTLFHESIHVFVGFLGNGRPQTPPKLNHPRYGGPLDAENGQGESGRFLENQLFGGGMEWARNPAEDDSQCGIPYLLDAAGGGREVLWSSISNLIMGRQKDLAFPLQVSQRSKPWADFVKFVYNSEEAERIGGIPGEDVRNIRFSKALQKMRPLKIRLEEIYMVSENPGIKLKVM